MSETIKDSINRADPNTLADALRKLGFGSLVRALPTYLRKQGVAASTYASATALVPTGQATDAPAASIVAAYARAGAGTPGSLVNDGVTSTAPAAGHIAISPNGQIVTAAADVWTDLDVSYIPEKGDVVEYTGDVVPGTGVMALPANLTSRGVVTLLESEALTGTVTGKKIVIEPAAAAVAATKSALKTNKAQVWFAIADAVSTARVKLLVVSSIDVNAVLESTNDALI